MAKAKIDDVKVSRRVNKDRREGEDRRKKEVPVSEDKRTGERRKVQRRRQLDPTPCQRDSSDTEIEFMQALDAYKRANGRMFPTCSEILEVIHGLGYVRLTGEQREQLGVTDEPASSAAAEPEQADGLEDEVG